MATYRDQGIVLRTWKLGETDRICSLLTAGRGKVRAVAKGVRRPGSRFGGRLEPFSHVDVLCYEGRNLDIINQADLVAPHASIRADWETSACGSVIAEAVDRVAQEGERSTRLLLLTLEALRALDRGPEAPAVVVDAFLWRMVSLIGYHPYLDACAACGEPGAHAAFHIAAGGTLCERCAPSGSSALSPGVRTQLEVLASTSWPDLVPGEPGPRRVAGALVASFVSHHLGKPLRSLELVPR